jgi:hypothetical protein
MPISISENVTYKRLIAVGNSKVYYEDVAVAGTMVELTTTGNAIDTTDQLNMFGLSQKAFVVNGTKLKIADFVNTKITDDSSFTNKPTRGQLVYQAGTSPAVMLVDYISSSGTDTMYGTVLSGTFQETTAITTAVSGGGSVVFPSPAAPVSSPHWYSWEVFDGDTTTYGTMPASAYLGCGWRGRAVLAGNPYYPFEWYMSRQFNPYDFQYVTAEVDPQVAVVGSVSDAGQVPDIPRALIPVNDDYLVFGCADSVECLVGDPAAGGSFLNISKEDGVFGSMSWCVGDNNTLYYFGTMGGIYKTVVPGPATCISRDALPNLLKDEAMNPSTHRISMAYDRKRKGILTCITKLADGTNSNYWFDFTTEGFFPESYPTQCGPYSLCVYPANSPTLSELLVGCTDGYIRRFDDTDKDDDIGGTDQAINAYVTFGPIELSGDTYIDGILEDMELVLAGGAGSSHGDSNNVTYQVYIGRTAEDAVESAEVATSPKLSGTFTAPGRQRGKRQKKGVRGKFAMIKLYNLTATQTWGMEKLLVSLKAAGRII